jgi:hypothetical protein
LQVRLADLQFYEHDRSCTLWLDPQSEELIQLQAALVAAFPECIDLSNDPSRSITSFSPHLSLGQWRSVGDVKKAQQAGLLCALPSEF